MTARTLTSTLLVAGLVGFLAGQVFSEDPPMSEAEMWAKMMELAQPGAMHKHLEPLAGEFDAATKMWMQPGAPPTEDKATTTNTWILGGRYLRLGYKGRMMGMPFEGVGLFGHDNFKEQFQHLWVDSMSSGMSMMTGSCSDDGKTITLVGTWDGPMGSFPTRYVYKIQGADRYVMEGYSTHDGQEVKEMEITYTRRK